MARRDPNPNFVESVARGLDLIRAFKAGRADMTLAELATGAGVPRPTAARLLYTLEALGYVRHAGGSYSLTVRTLELGMVYVQQIDMWDVARPRLQALVARTGESSSIAELDGSDIVYVARVAVPKLVALVVSIGTKFPAAATSLGNVLLAGLTDEQVVQVMSEPSRSKVTPRWRPDTAELLDALAEVRAQGWSLTDEQLASGVRSVAAPLRDGSGAVRAAVNVTVHAGETSKQVLLEEHLPHLVAAASAISADWARRDALPLLQVN